MPRKDPNEKLPLPGPWQPAVQAAMHDLSKRLALPTSRLTVTRVQALDGPTSEAEPELDVWLLAAGRSHRYRVATTSGAISLETAGG